MWRLRQLTLQDVESLCRQADKIVNRRTTVSPIRHIVDGSSDVDARITREWHEDKVRLLRSIQSLPIPAQVELAALFWLGRGDAPLEQVLSHAKTTYSPSLPYYLAERPSLSAYIKQGVQALTRQPH